MYDKLRTLLFKTDPEIAHRIALRLMQITGSLPLAGRLLQGWLRVPSQPVSAFGLHFKNPVGLAAGYDKDGLAWRGLSYLGFGHIEIGTVTLKPQPGNPRPRIFRLPEDRALINRMGFPSRGAEFVTRCLQQKRPPGLVVGVNIGKNKETPLDSAVEEYIQLFQCFVPYCDYLAINVSSPNTVGLRRLQARRTLDALLRSLVEERDRQAGSLRHTVPLLVKLSPDLSWFEFDDAIAVALDAGMDGLILTNTTLVRDGLVSSARVEQGGLSGAPLRQRSTDMIRRVFTQLGDRLPVIAAGGVMSTSDAREKLEAGARLVQVYTGLVYAGPAFVKQIMQGLTGC